MPGWRQAGSTVAALWLWWRVLRTDVWAWGLWEAALQMLLAAPWCGGAVLASLPTISQHMQHSNTGAACGCVAGKTTTPSSCST
jgi:hypothetical protein